MRMTGYHTTTDTWRDLDLRWARRSTLATPGVLVSANGNLTLSYSQHSKKFLNSETIFQIQRKFVYCVGRCWTVCPPSVEGEGWLTWSSHTSHVRIPQTCSLVRRRWPCWRPGILLFFCRIIAVLLSIYLVREEGVSTMPASLSPAPVGSLLKWLKSLCNLNYLSKNLTFLGLADAKFCIHCNILRRIDFFQFWK